MGALKIRESYARALDSLKDLFYRQKPPFEQTIEAIGEAAKTESI